MSFEQGTSEAFTHEAVANPTLKILPDIDEFDQNIMERVSYWPTRVSYFEAYLNLYADPLDLKQDQVRALHRRFRLERIIIPDKMLDRRRREILVYKKEHLCAIFALIRTFQNERDCKDLEDLVFRTRSTIGTNPISKAIHDPIIECVDGQREKIQLPKYLVDVEEIKASVDEVELEREEYVRPLVTKRGTHKAGASNRYRSIVRSSKKDALAIKKEIPYLLREYELEAVRWLFDIFPNNFDSANLVDQDISPELLKDMKDPIVCRKVMRALLEIACFHIKREYNPKKLDDLDNRTVKKAAELCLGDFESGYENIHQILEAVRKAKGV